MGQALIDYNTPLTETERRFAEEQHETIYMFLNQKRLPKDEYYDIAAIGYLHAVKKYFNIEKTGQYAFTTVAFNYMKTVIYNHFRNEKIKMKNNVYGFADNVICTKDICNTVCEREYYSSILKKIVPLLNGKEIKAFVLMSLGYSQKSIIKLMGYSSVKSLDYLINKARKRLNMCYGENANAESIAISEKKAERKDYTRGRNVYHSEIKKLHDEGIPEKEIAAKLGCSMSTVYRIRRENGLETNNLKYKTSNHCIDYDKVKKLYDKGMYDEDIAKQVNCSKNTVRNWRGKNGLRSNRANAVEITNAGGKSNK